MISSHWILLGILHPHSPTTLMQSLMSAGTEKAAEKLNQPIWADDQTSWSFSTLLLMLTVPKDINIFSQHKTMQFLPQSSFTHIKANLNILKQAKEAWEYGIFFWSKQAIGWIQHNGPDTEIFQGFLQSSGAGHDRLPSVTTPIKCFTSALYSLLAEACDSTAANPAQ